MSNLQAILICAALVLLFGVIGAIAPFNFPLNLVAHKRVEVVEAPAQPLTGRVIWLVEDDMLLRRAIVPDELPGG